MSSRPPLSSSPEDVSFINTLQQFCVALKAADENLYNAFRREASNSSSSLPLGGRRDEGQVKNVLQSIFAAKPDIKRTFEEVYMLAPTHGLTYRNMATRICAGLRSIPHNPSLPRDNSSLTSIGSSSVAGSTASSQNIFPMSLGNTPPASPNASVTSRDSGFHELGPRRR